MKTNALYATEHWFVAYRSMLYSIEINGFIPKEHSYGQKAT